MGWKLANAAYSLNLAGKVSDRARLALDFMARTAWDEPTPTMESQIYDGGYLGIGIHLLGLEKGASDAGRTAAKRVIKELVDAELIKLERRGGAGRSAEYRLMFDPEEPVDNYRPRGGRRAKPTTNMGHL